MVVTMVLFLAVILAAGFQLLGRFSMTAAEDLAVTVLGETDMKVNQFFASVEDISESLIRYSPVYSVQPEEMREIFLANVLARKEYIRAIYLGTAEGRMYEWGHGEGFIDYTPSFPEGYNPVERPWYRTGREAGRHTFTSPYVYASIDKLGITSVNPVYHPDGRFVGILGIDIMLENLSRILGDLDIPKGGKAALISENGEVIASQFGEPGEWARSEVHRIFLDNLNAMKRGESGRFIGNTGKGELFFSFKQNRLTRWILLVVFPHDAIRQGIGRTLTIIALVYLFMTILVTIILFSLSRGLIIKPLEDLFAVMKRIEGGEQQVRADINTENELAILGAQFNRLVGIVEDYSQSLEEKVEARTAEILQLQQENTRLRIIEEKQRIFADIHDSIGAKLTNINICNNVALAIPEGQGGERQAMLERIASNCANAIDELREIVLGVAPADENGVEHYLALELPRRLALKDIAFKGPSAAEREAFLAPFPEPESRELLRILQELTSNVLKHSGAKNVFLSLERSERGGRLLYEDDGSGFDPERRVSGGYGLQSLFQRAQGLGGELTIEERPGGGCRITLFLGGRDG